MTQSETGAVKTVETDSDSLLVVQDLVKWFPLTQGIVFRRHIGDVKAVDGVSLEVKSGQTHGLVGESGCGKSTTGRAILRLHEPTSGTVFFEGEDITHVSRRKMNQVRRDMQIIFQDPFASLNPRMTIRDIITEALTIHKIGNDSSRKKKAKDLLEVVGLDPEHANRYPHQFSGGQRQRIGVARALALDPKLIIADEPVSALDVSIQAQLVNLLTDIQKEFGIAFLFIAHDLAVVRHISSHVSVMYLGHIVESGSRNQIYNEPQHPYTQALLSAVPVADRVAERTRERIVLEGDLPSPANPPSGCVFRTRCWKAEEICANVVPELRDLGGGQMVACHFPEPRSVLSITGVTD
jgi:oligopeptide/dipeptide ABC transporter ATP-binding protein